MKAEKIEDVVLKILAAGTAFWAVVAANEAAKRKAHEDYYKEKNEGANGIGAAKRRIFKEISLAQQAGVDFTKKYDELSEDEIESLQRVSNKTGYTETYYKSLKKAYDAISGIGEAYDVTDENGNTVLTWIEDPQAQPYPSARSAADDDPERYRALIEAREIEDDRIWAEQQKARERDELEARLAESRKRLRKAGRSSQMQLFGVGELNIRDLLEPDLLQYVADGLDANEVADATDQIMRDHYPLNMVNSDLYDQIINLVEDWCTDNAIDPDSIWDVVDPEDIFWEI